MSKGKPRACKYTEEFQDFLDYLRADKGYRDNTCRSYLSDLSIFREFVGQPLIQLADESPEKLERLANRWKRSLYNDGQKPSSINRRIAALKTFFKYAAREKLIGRNPVTEIEPMKKPKALPKALSREEVKRLFAQFRDAEDLLFFGILLHTGLRISELYGLDKAHDVDFDELSVEPKPRLTVRGGKGGKDRVVFLGDPNAEAVKLLNRWPGTWSRKLRRISERFRLAAEGAGVKATPHALRHTYATWLLKDEVPMEVLQHQLGHSSISTTQIYAEVDNDHVADRIMRATKKVKE